jgi:hypothetical protein
MDLDGADFSNPTEIDSSKTNTITVTTKNLNSNLVAKGFNPKKLQTQSLESDLLSQHKKLFF